VAAASQLASPRCCCSVVGMRAWLLALAVLAPAYGLRSTFAPVHGLRNSPAKRSAVRLELSPRDTPGNYVQPFSSALAVSTAGMLLGELIPVPGSVDAAVPILGRVAAISSVPLLVASFAALRTAAFVGPKLLRSQPYVRLTYAPAADWPNPRRTPERRSRTMPVSSRSLFLALSSVLACALAPMPVLSVVVARGGSALLCLEVWSHSSSGAGDPLKEATAALATLVAAGRRTGALLLDGLPFRSGSASGSADSRAPLVHADARLPARFAALALAHAALALLAPRAAGAIWPLAAPGSGAVRIACSTSVLAAGAAAILADVAASRPAAAATAALAPFRRLNAALGFSALAHLVVQAMAAVLRRARPDALAATHLPTALAAAAAAQLIMLATAAVCAAADPVFYD
jgi:hypothetical protein